RPAPASVQLPRAVREAREHQCAGILVADPREHHVRAVAEGREEPLEVLARVQREAIALAHRAQHAQEPIEVARLLGDDALALALLDVLPRLLPHRGLQRVRIQREVHEQGAPRLHEDGRPPHARPRERVAERAVRRDLGVAQEARAAFVRERVAHRDDRVREAVRLDQRSARRVRDRDPERQSLGQHLGDAAVEDEATRAPAGRRLELSPRARLEDVPPARRDDELVPAVQVRGFRGARYHLRRVFVGKLTRGVRAFRIPLAAVEHRPSTTATADELALPAVGAGDTGLLKRLLHVLAVGIARAPDERPKATATLRERLAALGAHLPLDDLELRLLLAFERLRVIARTGRLRIALLRLLESRARVEAAEASELDHHRASALGADPVGGHLGHVGLLHRLGLLLDALGEGAEEVAHDRDPLDLALGDLVQVELHARREPRVDDVGEVLLQEVRDDEADVLGDERAAFLADVTPSDERGDRWRVRGGTADAELRERLHQRRLGEARRRLREVLCRREAQERELLALDDRGQRRDFLLGLVGALGVHADEAVERDAATVGAQHVLPRFDVEAGVLELRGRHLRRERALPDERVELQLVRLEVLAQVRRRAREVRRPDRLVGLLRALRARLVVARVLERVFGPELLRDDVLRLAERALGDVQRVGAHIGDEPDRRVAQRDAFVQLLRHDHRLLHREAELARGVLLERRRGVRGRGVARALAGLEALDDVRRLLEGGPVPLGMRAIRDLELLALVLDDLGPERLAGLVREIRLDAPVLDGREGLDLALAIDDEAQRDGLDASGRQAVADLLPEERRHRVADEPIDDAARLLRVHEVLVDLARVLEGVLDRLG